MSSDFTDILKAKYNPLGTTWSTPPKNRRLREFPKSPDSLWYAEGIERPGTQANPAGGSDYCLDSKQ